MWHVWGKHKCRQAEGKRPSEKQNLGVDRRRTLKCIIKK